MDETGLITLLLWVLFASIVGAAIGIAILVLVPHD